MLDPRWMTATAAVLTTLSTLAGAAETDINEKVVNLLELQAGGHHAGVRTNHAKGMVVSGEFTPASGAAALSRAPHWQGKPSKVLVRFSSNTGVPNLRDDDPNSAPRGMAIRFLLADGWTDIVTLSIPSFPVRTAEEFFDLLEALGASGPGAPSPTPVERYAASHPSVGRALGGLGQQATSLAAMPFFGVNSFQFTNAAGASRYGRYLITPLEPPAAAPAKPIGADYLYDGLRQRLQSGPVRYRLAVQLPAPGDVIEDGSTPWPADRPQVVVGELVLQAVIPEPARLAYNPANLTDGIAMSADPLLKARMESYPLSVQRRLAD